MSVTFYITQRMNERPAKDCACIDTGRNALCAAGCGKHPNLCSCWNYIDTAEKCHCADGPCDACQERSMNVSNDNFYDIADALHFESVNYMGSMLASKLLRLCKSADTSRGEKTPTEIIGEGGARIISCGRSENYLVERVARLTKICATALAEYGDLAQIHWG